MADILLIEDDPVLGRGLSLNLELEGYRVHWARDLAGGFAAFKKKAVDLVLLDLGLPDGTGLQFLRETRKEDPRVPIVILTAQTAEESVVEGLQSGANDYVRKPFGDRELMARIKTALREPDIRAQQLRYGNLVMLLDRRQLMHHGNEIELSPREFDILAYFMHHAEAVVTRDALLQTIDKDGELFDRTIDSNISHVRSKLRKAGVESVRISSVYGVGYRLEKNDSSESI